MYSRISLITMLLGVIAAAFLGCTPAASNDPWAGTPEPRIVTTFAPLHCFALNVVGDQGTVKSLLTSQGPHHADPPTSQAAMLSKANILFANGLGVDDAMVRKMETAMGRGGPKVVKLGNELPKTMLLEGSGICCKDEDHDHGAPGHIHYDGHVWLGIEQAKAVIRGISDEVTRARGSEMLVYRQSAGNYEAKLNALSRDGIAMLKDKKERTILPFHGSLAYFAKSFDLKIIGPIQDVPGQDPTAKRLEELVQQCLKEKCRVIAVEPQYNAEGAAKTLLEELKRKGIKDAEIVVIDPLETAIDVEFGPDWYEKKMRANLETLAKALR